MDEDEIDREYLAKQLKHDKEIKGLKFIAVICFIGAGIFFLLAVM